MEHKIIIEQEPYELKSKKGIETQRKAEKFLDLLPKIYGYEKNNTGGIKMNNLQELELRVENAKKELEEVTRLLEESKNKPKRFKPKNNEEYWYIDGAGNIACDTWINHEMDEWRLITNNCFRTREEVEEVKKKIEIQAEFEKLAELSWGDEKIDWEDDNQSKWNIFYHYIRKLMYFDVKSSFKVQGVKYFKTEESLRETINHIGEENILKYVLEV